MCEALLSVALPAATWSQILGLLWSIAWADLPVPDADRLATRLYVAYCQANGVDPTRAADLLMLLPEKLREQVRDHG